MDLNLVKTITTLFLDYAEGMAEEHELMTMQKWKDETDNLLKFRKKDILSNSGNISYKKTIGKSESEYEKYRVIQDQKYISSMDELYNKYLEENNKN